MRPSSSHSRSPRFALLAALAVSGVVLAGCGEDPFRLDNWIANPDTVFLYSLARPELNLPSGFNMRSRQRYQVETAGSTGNWDFMVNTVDGAIVLVTPSALGLDTRAAIAPIEGQSFEEIRTAPSDTTVYIRTEPVPMQVGKLYVVRTNRGQDQFGQSCTFYGKLEPLEVDIARGTLVFRFDTSPVCNNRALVPPGS